MHHFFFRAKNYSLVYALLICAATGSWSFAKGELQGSAEQTITEKDQGTQLQPTSIKEPLQGFVQKDKKGTPRVPQWRMEAGSDEEIGSFYVGFLGKKVIPCDHPGHYVQIAKAKLTKWTGIKPFPCVVKMTKLQDGTGGYYFGCITSKQGPRGWMIPHPKEKGKQLKWGIYYLQPEVKVEGDKDPTPDGGASVTAPSATPQDNVHELPQANPSAKE